MECQGQRKLNKAFRKHQDDNTDNAINKQGQ